ncbi:MULTISPECIES: high frequency lysogenization protein HflD [Lonsdalea]|uniref:Lysogenization protein HflD n=2 Tax=Lonsdalea TaxID=1082702 RepID=A0ACD1JBN2_9GAMM|nr:MULTISPECIES: high frequency lysogenization protein HflD [Lonsdalea]OSM96182.1 lysogenization protein HflD [Lonsdalea populi]OSN00910.1 lysogenization protein HflD [Lonsdalea populi]QPQ25855.1 high frequency lysogenization protein HflD [Lonsdalea populi]RAT12966.1 lysogenization protein HflD [Lonsdalea quercina]RAT15329.1 lysogenization protein HflD [Lonsdalea quercina]
MAKNYYDITLALAGICQSASLVQQLATTGTCQQAALQTSLNSVLVMKAASTLEIFGNDENNLKLGVETLLGILSSSSREKIGADQSRYTLSLMALERRLHKNGNALNELGNRVDQLDRQLEHYELLSDPMINVLAGIYVDVISPLGPRIQVTGSQEVLKNAQVQAKVRAILLAGMRAAVLWQQIGGGRLQLMFSRAALVKQARQILSRCRDQ